MLCDKESKFTTIPSHFKDIEKGNSVILFAGGPTSFSFKKDNCDFYNNCKIAGVNMCWMLDDISNDLNYYFFGSGYNWEHFPKRWQIARKGKKHTENVDKLIKNNKDMISFASAADNGKCHGEIKRGNIST